MSSQFDLKDHSEGWVENGRKQGDPGEGRWWADTAEPGGSLGMEGLARVTGHGGERRRGERSCTLQWGRTELQQLGASRPGYLLIGILHNF